eukprot:366341-Chlamydomonas_euryale.AAC.1
MVVPGAALSRAQGGTPSSGMSEGQHAKVCTNGRTRHERIAFITPSLKRHNLANRGQCPGGHTKNQCAACYYNSLIFST